MAVAPPPAGDPGPVSAAGSSAVGPRTRRWLLISLTVAVAIGVVLTALVSVGIVPLFRNSPSPTYPAYAQATSLAKAAANASYGGGWGVVAGVALNSRSSLSRPFVGDNGQDFCAFKPLLGGGLVTIPATQGSVADGQSAYWTFVLRNSTGGILGVSVFNGSATVFGIGNYGCRRAYSSLTAFLPSTVMDSTRVVAITNSAGGTAFLRNHPAANVTMGLWGNLSLAPGVNLSANWEVAYSTCPIDVAASASGTGRPANTTFFVTVGAFNGTVMFSQVIPGACPLALGTPAGSAPLSSGLGLGPNVDSFGADSQIPNCAPAPCAFYNFTFQTAGASLLLGDLAFDVTSAAGAVVPVTGGVALVDLTGFVVGVYSFQSGNWSSMANLFLHVTTTLVLVLFAAGGPPLVGDLLVVNASPGFIGTIDATIT